MISESDIAATVKYGRYVRRRAFIALYILLADAILIPAATIAIVILAAAGQMALDREIGSALIAVNIFAFFLICVAAGLLLYHTGHNRQIKKWLRDAVVLNAKIYRLDHITHGYDPYQVAVRFTYDGVVKEQTQRPNLLIGNHKMLAKYVGDKVPIAYSPAYDQVIILR